MTLSAAVEGVEESMWKPLERSDPRSLALINKLLLQSANRRDTTCPLSFCIEMLAGIKISRQESRTHWKNILAHKRRLELILCRTVNIKTAAVDYYTELGVDAPPAIAEPMPAYGRKTPAASLTQGTIGAPAGTAQKRIVAPGVYQDRLKAELLRMRRYKHALSVLMLDVDLAAAPAQTSERVFDIIVKTISKAVRIVDIPVQYSADLFLLILPNTNKREAMELAVRLRSNIAERTSRISGRAEGIPAIIAVGQCSKDDTANEYIKRLEQVIKTRTRATPAAIHALE